MPWTGGGENQIQNPFTTAFHLPCSTVSEALVLCSGGLGGPALEHRHGMTRSAWKGPFVAISVLKDVMALAQRHPEWWSRGRFKGAKAPEVINTQSRASTILPDFLGCKFEVHNGKVYVPLEVTEPMIGHRFGEFALTRTVPVHKVKENKAGAKRVNPKTGKSG